MSDNIELQQGDLKAIYGSTFFLVPGDELSQPIDVVADSTSMTSEAPQEAPVKGTEEKPLEETVETVNTSAGLRPTGAIQWRPKPSSRVLFILQQAELKDKELTELLKKIVQSIGIPFDAAGFGIVKGEINQADLEGLPNPFGVVFDKGLGYSEENPVPLKDHKELFFSYKLGELKDNKQYKIELWEHLKKVKEKLG